jgi:hypothetical protein
VSAPSGNDPPIDIGPHLGTGSKARTHRFTIYIPDRDRNNRELDHIDYWIDAGMKLLTEINGGCTRLPNTTGHWLSDDREIVKENTALLYSYFQELEAFEKQLPRVRDFLHRFGRETNQGEVMVELSGEDNEGLYSRAYHIPSSAWQTR